MRHMIFILGCLLCFSTEVQADYNDFETNPYILPEAREKMRPFLLPEDHPAKEKLDSIFQSVRASFNDEALVKAGFHIKFKQPRSFIRVVSHPTLPGYLLKLVTDVELRKKDHEPEWHWFINRCLGVTKIHEVIKKNNIKYFVAPQKWIYPLPLHPYPSKSKISNIRKVIVLLVEDMKLTEKEDNLTAWRAEVTKKHLDELYLIIRQVGGKSYRAENIPQTKKGAFAFVDTEYPTNPPSYAEIRRYLSSGKRAYWDRIVKDNK